ncbi:MAG: ATP-binding protein [Oscillospiraceae bacterium]|nr:ATP-binding protein [Oscillospiraceae bacterium]
MGDTARTDGQEKKYKRKLAAQFRNINMLFIAFILAAVISVCAVLIYNLTDSASKDYARFYTNESINVLNAYLSKEISILRHAAESAEITEWFTDEEDPEKKAAAYQRMMFYADMFQIDSVYFAMTDSLNEYSVNSGISFEEFAPFDALNPDVLYDQWFFSAVEAGTDFSLNLDVDKITNTGRLWINYKVMDGGRAVGIICSALQFDYTFQQMFRQYETGYVISYIIDGEGHLQVTSDNPNPQLLQSGDAFEEKIHILDMNSDPAFISAVTNHLEYPQYLRDTEVITLSKGDYQYLSVAQIPSTDWSMVTLYSSNALFDVRAILLTVFAVLLLFVAYIAASYVLNLRLVIRPLERLTGSVSEYEKKGIYGIMRDDEIGELARTTQNAIKESEQQTQILLTTQKSLKTANTIANELLSSQFEHFTHDLQYCMGLMARCIGVTRVRIWKNHLVKGKLHCSQLYEWSEDAAPQYDNQYTNSISYDDAIPGWEAVLSANKCINSLVRDMSETERAQLSPQGILSLMVVPVFLKTKFWGFVGFDCCTAERVFTASEEVIIRSASLLFVNSLTRYEMNRHLLETTAELEAAVDEAHRANTTKSTFLANMSHEIRTPMNSIVGFAELALDNDLPPKIKDYFAKILSNSEWLLQIINDILDISKIESGKMELENIPFDIGDMFNACRALILPKAIEKGLTVHFYAEPIEGKRIYGDPTRLRQVLVNLLSNAVKFTNSGMVRMRALTTSTSAMKMTMCFEIKDSGIGIPEAELGRIFDPFTQAESGTTRKFGGSGLGLAITKTIIEMMGGKLIAESTPGVGSKFSFELSFDAVDIKSDDTDLERIVFDDTEKPRFEGEVLLCEDNTMNQQVIAEHLERVGLKAVVAENGKVGVDIVQSRAENGEKQFDLILMDIHMPVMDGLEAAAKINALNTGIPIAAITANIMTSDREIYTSLGMKDCIGKPFTSQELWRCLMKYLKPVSWQKEPDTLLKQADMELRQKLINNFVINNSDKYREISDALNSGELKTAHRLAHSLKSSAAQLDMLALRTAAADVEKQLKDGENLVTPEQLTALEAEFDAVLTELKPLVLESLKDTTAEPPAESKEELKI